MTTYDATATPTGVDKNWQDQTIVCWHQIESDDYRIESGEYGIVHDYAHNETYCVDADGCPVDYNDYLRDAVLAICPQDCPGWD
jgi:hypothetical protein